LFFGEGLLFASDEDLEGDVSEQRFAVGDESRARSELGLLYCWRSACAWVES
jgi:hypothetical protein